MPRRPATVTQADVARAIRAVIAAGLSVVRVVARADGVAIETAQDSAPDAAPDEAAPGKSIVL